METKTTFFVGQESVTTYKLEDNEVSMFLPHLENHLYEKFGAKLPENYGRDKPWSLLNLIENNEINSYILIYVNDILWGGTGGMIREHHGEKIYQAGFRVFTNTRKVHTSLGSKTYIHDFGTKHHIEKAKTLGCKKVILSFNDYNYNVYKLTKNYHLPKSFKEEIWQSNNEMIEFNGVKQWLLTMYL